MSSTPQNPVRFDPSMEKIEAGEAETIAALNETMRHVRETTFKDSGEASRSVHAKCHGVLKGTLDVLDNLPPVLAQGLFATPGSYSVAMRFSTIPGDTLADSVSVPRGLAVKVIGVVGERLPGSESDTTQDFVLVDAPAFAAGSAKEFLANAKLLAATTDKAEGTKKVLSAINRTAEAVIEAFGFKSPLISTLGGHPATNILGETFYSQVPLLYGAYICKVCVAPVSPELVALHKKYIDIGHDANAIRSAVREFFAMQGGTWELRVQLCTDLDAMPIEKASAAWPEDQSPYIAVARITAPPQDSWNEDALQQIDKGHSFSPWHGLAAHRPLGSIMRARKSAYEQSAAFRGQHQGCPIHEPRGVQAAE